MRNIHVKRLPRLAGIAAWDAILNIRTPYPELEGRQSADFAIIGGGFAGLSAARRLRQLTPEASIAIIDAGQIGQGSAGRNSGFMIDLPHELTSDDYAGSNPSTDHLITRLNRQAISFAADAVLEYGIPSDYFRRDGKINGAASDAAHIQNQQYGEHLEVLGESFEMLDAQAMWETTGSRHYVSGLYTPGTVMIQPAGYVRGVADGLARQADIYEMSPVTGLTRIDDGWSITTAKGQLDAAQVILATNGHLESFGFAKGRLMQVFLFACMTEELSDEALKALGGSNYWGITPSDPLGTTVRRISTQQGGNRLIVRTMTRLMPEMQTTSRQLTRAEKMMREKFDSRFPQLSDVKLQYAWDGHLCLSMNGVSVAQKLGPGLFSACVQNGLGLTRGTLTGIAAAEHALEMQSDVTRFFDEQDQPSRLPPAPFAKLGANMIIRWKEWRAHKE